MRIAVIGVGGVGGYYGGLLARAGEDVTFVARGEQFSALKSSGLSVKTVEGDFTVAPAKVVDTVEGLGNPEVVIVATKTYDRDNVADRLAAVVNESTVVIPVQNGIDNDRQMKKRLPRAQVYPGLAYIISARTQPGLIEQTAGPRTIFFGDREDPANPVLQDLEARMKRAGILASASADIDQELWTKFLWITTFAGMTALCRCPIGVIVNDHEAFNLYIRCQDEGLAVAAACRVALGENVRRQLIEKSEHYRSTGSHSKSSLLIDLENRRQTEIEALNGTIVRLARQFGVPVPIHETIYQSVKLAEQHYLETKGR